MDYEIRRVTTRSDWRGFLALPRKLYRKDPLWIPSLDSDVRRTLDSRKNPYFRSAQLGVFLCLKDGIPVARTTAVVNPAYALPGGRLPAMFGYFESDNDAAAVRALFSTVGEWCRQRGATDLHGPFHPHHYSELGLQADKFDEHVTFFQTHHPQKYLPLLQQTGFIVERMLHTRRNPDIREWLDRHPAPQALAPQLHVRPVRLSDLASELERIREVYNDAFADNCFFLPVSSDEYRFAARDLRLVTRPDLNVIVEHGEEPVGVLQCVLDVNPLLQPMRGGRATPFGVFHFLTHRSHIRRLIVYAVGIKRHWQRGRVHALLFDALHRMARNFDELETTWMSPDNAIALHAAERFGMTEDKHFAIMTRPVTVP
ncbi:MAG: hypothetical protein A3H45_06980 [Ignavibacteria bacterium RIFCSPLOWO2_02_FULL_55_14]|nr:MAG: hypothetical protein A3H45_06980 [Ignavibacteria bacterium RIFCSPLOWO2_02_FULL_55_14]